MKLIQEIHKSSSKNEIGSKAKSLRYLLRKGFRIPKTFVVPYEARVRYDTQPEPVGKEFVLELDIKLNPKKKYAVRSSSNMEDLNDYSFAGQFQSFLNVSGSNEILEHVKKIWSTADKVIESAYFRSASKTSKKLNTAVILQEMVDAEWSGVAFSVNPVSGRDEIIIEATQGLADNLVQKGLTPLRWIYSQGNWIESEQNNNLNKTILQTLCDEIIRLKKGLKTDVDVEWAFDGKRLFFLQSRPVTTKKYPTVYSNHISREFLPGLIKPLVWTVNTPLVNSAWLRLLQNLLGKLDIQPEHLSQTFYYRAYFNMGTMGMLFNKMGLPKNSLESLMGRKDPSGKSAFKPSIKVLKYFPRMIFFLATNLHIGKQFEKKLPMFEEMYKSLKKSLEDNYNPIQYHNLFNELMDLSREAAYFNIVLPLLNQIYTKRLGKKIGKKNITLEQLDFTLYYPELLNYKPDTELNTLKEHWKKLGESEKTAFNHWTQNGQPYQSVTESFGNRYTKFITKFGHFSESGNDFSYPPWRENPKIIISQLKMDDTGDEQSIKSKNTLSISELKTLTIFKAYKKAGKYLLYREIISSTYTKIYGLFRILFINSAKQLVKNGKLKSVEDVFYLSLKEHNTLLKKNDREYIHHIQKKTENRKQEMLELSDIQVPDVVYGELPPAFKKTNESIYKGTPVSSGSFEGRVVVVNGYDDFEKEVKDSILVIPFSDVGWTPILTKAGAIVSQSGGMLSHASIIARELSIPAIASVDNVCSLKDGTVAIVDGSNGILRILNQ